MEIVFKNSSQKFKVPDGVISGIYSDSNFFSSFKVYSINGVKVTKKNRVNSLKDISIIKNDIDLSLFNTLEEYMNYYIEVNNLNLKDPYKKILGSLKIVSLKENVLHKSISSLSSTERCLASLALSLLNNPKELIFVNYFDFFDVKLEKKIYRLLMELNDKYNIGIILLTRDVEKLYKYASYSIIITSNYFKEGDTKEVFQDAPLLIQNNIEVPDTVLFTYKAREMGAGIDYHRDVRDIIKDIYKHV